MAEIQMVACQEGLLVLDNAFLAERGHSLLVALVAALLFSCDHGRCVAK